MSSPLEVVDILRQILKHGDSSTFAKCAQVSKFWNAQCKSLLKPGDHVAFLPNGLRHGYCEIIDPAIERCCYYKDGKIYGREIRIWYTAKRIIHDETYYGENGDELEANTYVVYSTDRENGIPIQRRHDVYENGKIKLATLYDKKGNLKPHCGHPGCYGCE
jgi:hypothetical protein